MPPVLFGSQSSVEFTQAWTKQWAQTQGNRNVDVLVGDELKQMKPRNALMYATSEWFHKLAISGENPWREMFLPGQATPSIATAAVRVFGLRALPFEEPKQIERAQNEIERRTSGLKATLKQLGEYHDQNLIPGGDAAYLGKRKSILATFDHWYDNHPYVKAQRYYYGSPSFGEQYWIDADLEDLERRGID